MDMFTKCRFYIVLFDKLKPRNSELCFFLNSPLYRIKHTSDRTSTRQGALSNTLPLVSVWQRCCSTRRMARRPSFNPQINKNNIAVEQQASRLQNGAMKVLTSGETFRGLFAWCNQNVSQTAPTAAPRQTQHFPFVVLTVVAVVAFLPHGPPLLLLLRGLFVLAPLGGGERFPASSREFGEASVFVALTHGELSIYWFSSLFRMCKEEEQTGRSHI